MNSRKLLITGGSGFIGRALSQQLLDAGHGVWILSRNPEAHRTNMAPQINWVRELQQITAPIDVVINLAGANLFDQRWTPAYKQVLLGSRLDTTRQLVDWIASSARAPAVMISGSAIGYYGAQADQRLGEQAPAASEFQSELCHRWEQQAMAAEALGVRVCRLRIGIVLHPGGGALQRMLLSFRLGLGGRIGDGQQWMSWIHRQDLLAMISMLIQNDDCRGAFNAVAPAPVRNAEFSQTLAAALRRPAWLPMPPWLLRALLGEAAHLLTSGQRVVPEAALQRGFVFSYPTLAPALKALL